LKKNKNSDLARGLVGKIPGYVLRKFIIHIPTRLLLCIIRIRTIRHFNQQSFQPAIISASTTWSKELNKKTIKIFIPMAGLGTRLRPHTWSRPKQLIHVADRTVLDHVLGMFETLTNDWNIEYIFIVGYLGEMIKAHMQEVHPDMDVKYVIQEEMLGQSHALYLAKEHMSGPMLMVFADTLIESDLSFLAKESADGVAWVKSVPDPRRFGVAVTDEQGWVQRLVEKPEEVDNPLVVVGCYYLRRAEDLLLSIEEQMRRDTQLKGEYFLADALNIALEGGLRMHIQEVEVWLDAGTPEDVLKTNAYLLEHGRENSKRRQGGECDHNSSGLRTS
jgi:glucose-1-phosphate thymidylyltransferase